MSLHFQESNGVMGWYNTKTDTFEPTLCDGCNQPFTQDAYDDAHWFENGTYHDHCCPVNDMNDPDHSTYSNYPLTGAQIIASGYDVFCPVCHGEFHIIALDEEYNCPHCDALLDLSWSEDARD